MSLIYDAPTGLTVTAATYSTINLSWTQTEDNVQVEIQRKEAGGTYFTLAWTDINTTSYSDTSCSSNTRYYYQIRYYSFSDESAWTTAVDAWTYPQPPSALAVSWSGKTATLTWTNNGTYTYIGVYYKLSSEPTTWTTDTATLTGTLTTRNITVSTESVARDFRIRAYNSSSTQWSDYATVSTSVSGVMAPTGLAGISGGQTALPLRGQITHP